LEAQGFLSLPDFFKQTAIMAWHQNVQSKGYKDKDMHVEGGTVSILVPVFEEEVEEEADMRSMHVFQVNDNNAEEEEEEANKADERSKCAVQVDGNSKAKEEEEEEEEETPTHML
jgi:hypothetical protein